MTESDQIKLQLEQKQRTARAEREKAAETLGISEHLHVNYLFTPSACELSNPGHNHPGKNPPLRTLMYYER